MFRSGKKDRVVDLLVSPGARLTPARRERIEHRARVGLDGDPRYPFGDQVREDLSQKLKVVGARDHGKTIRTQLPRSIDDAGKKRSFGCLSGSTPKLHPILSPHPPVLPRRPQRSDVGSADRRPGARSWTVGGCWSRRSSGRSPRCRRSGPARSAGEIAGIPGSAAALCLQGASPSYPARTEGKRLGTSRCPQRGQLSRTSAKAELLSTPIASGRRGPGRCQPAQGHSPLAASEASDTAVTSVPHP